MPLVGRRSYLGNAGLRTMRTAGEEVGFNLTGHVYSSPLTFGLSEMCNESPGGASPSLWLLPGPPGPAALQSAWAQQPPTSQTRGRDFSRVKNQTDAKPQKYPALICKLAKRDPGAEQRRRRHQGR